MLKFQSHALWFIKSITVNDIYLFPLVDKQSSGLQPRRRISSLQCRDRAWTRLRILEGFRWRLATKRIAQNHQVDWPLFTLAFQITRPHFLLLQKVGPHDWQCWFLQCLFYAVLSTVYHPVATIKLKTVHWKAIGQRLSTFVFFFFPF